MTKINQFDRNTLQKLRPEIENALKSVSEKYGISFKTGSIKFSDKNFTVAVEAAVLNDDGQAETADVVSFRRYAHLYGLKSDQLGAKFKHGGYQFAISGMSPRSHKRPILAKRTDGKVFKFSSDTVKGLLAIA